MRGTRGVEAVCSTMMKKPLSNSNKEPACMMFTMVGLATGVLVEQQQRCAAADHRHVGL
jgi:hypothetical protein